MTKEQIDNLLDQLNEQVASTSREIERIIEEIARLELALAANMGNIIRALKDAVNSLS